MQIRLLLPLLPLLAACSRLAAEPTPNESPVHDVNSPHVESKQDSINEVSIPRPTEDEKEQAVVLSCPGEAFRILVLTGGTAFLQNLEIDENDPGAFLKLPLRDPLNPPKASLTCAGSQFRLRTSPPFSNRSIEQQFSIDTAGLHFLARRESDPAEHMIEDAFRLALRGNRTALSSIDFTGIEYLYQYVNASRFERYLDGAVRRCERAPCQPILESTFYLLVRLSAAAAGIEYDPEQTSSWVRALDEAGVPMSAAAPALLRYAEILRRQGKVRSAADLLGEMVERETNAPDLHLVYGDLLWDLNKKEEARRQYRLFADMVSREGRPVPTRIARLLDDI